MADISKVFDAFNSAVKVVATSGEELQFNLMAACRDYVFPLEQHDFTEGLYFNFQILSKKLYLNDEDYQNLLLNTDQDEATKLIKAICDFQVQVCEEYFVPGSY